jgi:predicted RNA-binding Zn ribbon-like protein
VTDGFQPGGRAPAPAPLRLVQDFVNTEIPDFHQDDLATPDELAVWLHGQGLVGDGVEVGADLFVAARSLRAALRELALANTLRAPLPPPRARAVDESLGRFPLRLRVVDGAPRLVPVSSGAAGGLAAIVAVVADARAAGTWPRLKACRGENCGWVCYDGSRNRSSGWCSMQVCGGRAKASAYRARRAARGVR